MVFEGTTKSPLPPLSKGGDLREFERPDLCELLPPFSKEGQGDGVFPPLTKGD